MQNKIMKTVVGVLAIGLLAISSLPVGNQTATAAGNPRPLAAEIEHCQDTDAEGSASGYLNWPVGEYQLQTNRWNTTNVTPGSNYKLCVKHDDSSTSGDFWVTKQEGSAPTNAGPTSYPSIIAGCHWGDICSPVSHGMPKKVSDIVTIPSSWTVVTPNSGTWDAAYDIWFHSKTTSSGQNDGAEIMIWLDTRNYSNQQSNPANTIRPSGNIQAASFKAAGYTWDVWVGRIGDSIQWNVISYVRQQAPGGGASGLKDFDAKVFIDYARTLDCPTGSKCILPSWYLLSIQAGFEPWVGGVGLKSMSFAVEVNPTSAGPAAYVKQGTTGTGDGKSWANAYPTLQDALAKVSSGEIWVAKGVYYPDEGGGQVNNNRDATFRIKNNVAIYGGFAGTETSRNARDVTTHLTVLSGDIDGDDTTDTNKIVQKPPHPAYNPPNPADMTSDIKGNNAYHVVSSINVTRTALLDGFVITAGYGGEGGGLRNDNGSPTLTNLRFHGNYATLGGGMGNFNRSSPLVSGVTFSGNSAMVGGGMYNHDSNPIVDNSVFSGNWAVEGAGMMSDASGVHYDPAKGDFAYVLVTNSTFAGNYARSSPVYGAAVQDKNSIVIYANCIVWGNAPSSMNVYSEGSMGGFSSSVIESYKTLFNGGGAPEDDPYVYSDRGRLTNTKVEPQFVTPISPSQAPTTAGNYRLQRSSPAIDAGNTLSVTVSVDRDDNWRFADGDADGFADVDMGAYEFSELFHIYLPDIWQRQE